MFAILNFRELYGQIKQFARDKLQSSVNYQNLKSMSPVEEGRASSPLPDRPFQRPSRGDQDTMERVKDSCTKILNRLGQLQLQNVSDSDFLTYCTDVFCTEWKSRKQNSEIALRGMLLILELCLAQPTSQDSIFDHLVSQLGFHSVAFWKLAVPLRTIRCCTWSKTEHVGRTCKAFWREISAYPCYIYSNMYFLIKTLWFNSYYFLFVYSFLGNYRCVQVFLFIVGRISLSWYITVLFLLFIIYVLHCITFFKGGLQCILRWDQLSSRKFLYFIIISIMYRFIIGWTCSLGVFPVSIKNEDFLSIVNEPQTAIDAQEIKREVKYNRKYLYVVSDKILILICIILSTPLNGLPHERHTTYFINKILTYTYQFFEKHPERKGLDVLFQVAVTNRRAVESYRKYQVFSY
uniref:Nucleoporin NDC1 n=1 Tax=Heterorhabditis bacteriophora TaxID=37862 RepID=A0A1I7WP19_HETBA